MLTVTSEGLMDVLRDRHPLRHLRELKEGIRCESLAHYSPVCASHVQETSSLRSDRSHDLKLKQAYVTALSHTKFATVLII